MQTAVNSTIAAANDRILAISPYQPGKPIDELKRELGIEHIIKLASNENPLGASAQALAAAQTALAEANIYPDGNGFNLKQAIHKKFGVSMHQITLGNGSNDILELVARTFVNPNDEVIYAQHAFAVYALATQAVGALGVEVPANHYGHDLNAMADAITTKTKVIFLANPNNPTGTWFDEDAFNAFMQRVPAQVLVVLDEAYVEYFPDAFNSIPLLHHYRNLLISRTFSKAYGLAGLRVGFALASDEITDLLNRVRQPFNVNAVALVAAQAALHDEDFVQQTRTLNEQGLQYFYEQLNALQLEFIPSRANFVCINVGVSGQHVFEQLLHKGVIVRSVGGYSLPTFIRVTVGTMDENRRFFEALRTVLAEMSAVG